MDDYQALFDNAPDPTIVVMNPGGLFRQIFKSKGCLATLARS